MAEMIVEGIDRLQHSIDSLIKRSFIASEKIVRDGAIVIAAAAKAEFQPRPGGSQRTSHLTGRIYYKGAPDFPANPPRPTNRSGLLRRSIRMIRANPISASGWESLTGPTENYGPFVEYGTSRARAFPFMKPAMDKAAPALAEIYRREWSLAQEL